MGKMRCAVDKIDISPPKGVELAGYPGYLRHNKGIHDKLYATCLYISDGNKEVLLITLDIIFISKIYVKTIRELINKETKISKKNISISCSHTHSGPWASGRLDLAALENDLKPDKEYVNKLIEKIVFIVKKTVSKTFKGQVGFNKARCGKEQGVGGNRRDKDGVVDDEVYVLAIKDEKEEIRSVIVNYALHPTFLHANNEYVSSDYVGYLRHYIHQKYPFAQMLFMQGFSGNQSSRYFRKGQSYDEAKRVGYEIGKACKKAIDNIEYSDCLDIFSLNEEIHYSIRKFPPLNVLEENEKKAKKEYENLKKNNASYIEKQNANVGHLGSEDILGYAKMLKNGKKISLYDDEKPLEIMITAIGDIRFVFMPGEIFTEYALDIKNIFKNKPIFTVSVSNGCLPGYVYTKKAYKEGGYEVDTSMLTYKIGEEMVKKAVCMIRKSYE